jgi:uncharacterized protein YndB with AHSA1/START domain
MATNELRIPAPPAAVYEVLATGKCYGEWVVGANRIRDVDAGWPQPGSRIHHTVGFGPIHVRDTTEVREVDPGRRMLLLARVRPFGRAHVELTLEPDGTGTRAVMREWLVDRPGWLTRLLQPLIRVRNDASLGRLARLAQRHTVPLVD